MITSLTNEKMVALTKLHQRKYRTQQQRFLLVGTHYLEIAYKNNALETIVTSDETFAFYDVDIILVSQPVLDKLANTTSLAMVVGVCLIKEKPIDPKASRLLLTDEINDPGNLGTMIRSAVAFGFDGLICASGSVDFYNEKTIRASAGAIFELPLLKADLLEEISKFKKIGFSIIGTDVEQALPLSNIPTPDKLAIVLGNEKYGVSPEVLASCDMITTIEASAFESLNVAMATTILTYVFRK